MSPLLSFATGRGVVALEVRESLDRLLRVAILARLLVGLVSDDVERLPHLVRARREDLEHALSTFFLSLVRSGRLVPRQHLARVRGHQDVTQKPLDRAQMVCPAKKPPNLVLFERRALSA